MRPVVEADRDVLQHRANAVLVEGVEVETRKVCLRDLQRDLTLHARPGVSQLAFERVSDEVSGARFRVIHVLLEVSLSNELAQTCDGKVHG